MSRCVRPQKTGGVEVVRAGGSWDTTGAISLAQVLPVTAVAAVTAVAMLQHAGPASQSAQGVQQRRAPPPCQVAYDKAPED